MARFSLSRADLLLLALAGAAVVILWQGAHKDYALYGGAGDDALAGDGNDNLIWGGGGADLIDGGGGMDTLDYAGSPAGVQVDLAAGTGEGGDAEGDVIANIERIWGSAFADALDGDAEDNSLSGLAGADRLQGGGGNDQLYGGGGADVLRGGPGNDLLAGQAGADQLDGGAGADALDYRLSPARVQVNLAAGTAAGGDAEGDVIAAMEWVMGSAFADVLVGDGGRNRLYGLDGADRLAGGAGDDRLRGGAGADVIDGGGGADVLDYGDSPAGVQVDLAAGTGTGGDAEGDVITGMEKVWGSAFADVLVGDGGRNRLSGLDGADRLASGAGDDQLRGGGGADVLRGGPGADVFSFFPADGAAVDAIADFTESEDIVHFGAGFGARTFADLVIEAGPDGAVIDLTGQGGGRIVLRGVAPGALSAANFRFDP